MPLVNVMVNGRAYTIACDEGEEEHLQANWPRMVDAKAREVLGSVGQVGDTRLLLMAALLIADEHHDWLPKRRRAAEAANASSGEKTEPASARGTGRRQGRRHAGTWRRSRLEDIAARLGARLD